MVRIGDMPPLFDMAVQIHVWVYLKMGGIPKIAVSIEIDDKLPQKHWILCGSSWICQTEPACPPYFKSHGCPVLSSPSSSASVSETQHAFSLQMHSTKPLAKKQKHWIVYHVSVLWFTKFIIYLELNYHRIGWWENLQESPIFDGKNHGFL